MAGLTASQRRQLDEEGYVVVEGALDPRRDIAPVMAEYGVALDEIATALEAAGEIRDTYADLPFNERLIRMCEESGRTFGQHFDFSLPQNGVREDTPMHVGPAVFGLLTNPRLLDLVESVVGPEVYSNPVQHIRMKLPQRARSKADYSALVSMTPWHQDNGVVLPEADESHILTVWAPITEATVANGCLQVIPRSHRGDLLAHCPTDQGVTIPGTLIQTQDAIPLPMQPGSVLFMTQRTVHSSLDNTTDDEVRISFDLRYQPVGEPTGRPAFPGFVARSRAHPEQELRDPAEWARSWHAARATLAARENPTFNRWSREAAVCA